MIHEPTHFYGHNKSCLDLIFTNNPTIVSDCTVHPLINNCDHCPISLLLKGKIDYVHSYKRNVWDFKNGDFDLLRNILSNYRWDSAFLTEDVNECAAEFMSLLKMILQFCIPHYTTTIRPRDKPFMTSTLRQLMRKRDRLHKSFKKKSHRK